MKRMYIEGKVPGSCHNCEYFKISNFINSFGEEVKTFGCQLGGSSLTSRCPLRSLAEHDDELIKDTIQNIKQKIHDINLMPEQYREIMRMLKHIENSQNEEE